MADFDKPSNTEEEYFAREEIEKKRKLALEQSAHTAQAEKDRLKQLHFMRCPKCGMELQAVMHGSVEIDSCFNCGGIFLDAGELQTMLSDQKEGPVIGAVLNWFKRK